MKNLSRLFTLGIAPFQNIYLYEIIYIFFSFILVRKPNLRGREEIEKDEGISDEEDTAELKLQLELNEQVCIHI